MQRSLLHWRLCNFLLQVVTEQEESPPLTPPTPLNPDKYIRMQSRLKSILLLLPAQNSLESRFSISVSFR